MASITEVAKRAGVSIATVSRVINQSGYVNEKTRVLVMKAIAETGFVPSEIARSMLHKKTYLIALVVPDISNLFFASIAHEIEKILVTQKYKMMLCNSHPEVGIELEYIEMVKQNKVDGMIIISDTELQDYIQPDMPIVSFDRQFAHTPCVSSDNFQGGMLAAEQLTKAGCKRILYFGDDAGISHDSIKTEVVKRREGFEHYGRIHHVPMLPSVVFPKGGLKSIEVIVKELFDQQHFDGIFAISDFLASLVLKEALKRKKRVPQDLKIIGFDAIKNPLIFDYELDSIQQNIESIAKSLVDSLFKRIVNKQWSENQIIPVSFKKGNTV